MRRLLHLTLFALPFVACDPATTERTATGGSDCALPLGPPSNWPGDTISPDSRCAMLRLARAQLAALPEGAAETLSPADTARITGADVYDVLEQDGTTGRKTPWRHIEVDITGQRRRFVVRRNQRTGAVEAGQVHR